MKLLFAVVLAVAVFNVWGASVVQFHVEDEAKDLFDFLMKPHSVKHTRLGSFRYINCGDPSKDILNLKDLTIGPDPLSLPGTLTVSFTGSINSTVDGPLKANIVIMREVESTWIKIPCISGIGSCTYDDLCELLAGATCPEPFVTAKVPCKCPFTQGNYQMESAKFEIDAAVFPAGNYHMTANTTFGSEHVGCVELYATFV